MRKGRDSQQQKMREKEKICKVRNVLERDKEGRVS